MRGDGEHSRGIPPGNQMLFYVGVTVALAPLGWALSRVLPDLYVPMALGVLVVAAVLLLAPGSTARLRR